MIKKRLVGVITVKQGWAVQSFGFQRHLPLGRPEVVAENLDRWGVDEILLQCIDRSRQGLGPDLALLDRLSRQGLGTPLMYQGGIRSVDDAVAAVQAGAERIAIDSLLRDDPATAAALAGPLGAQAVVAALPLAWQDGELQWLDHRHRNAAGDLVATPLPAEVLAVLRSGAISEALLIDWRHEGGQGGQGGQGGTPGSFDEALLDHWPLPGLPLIAFGGLADPLRLRQVLQRPAVVAAGVGNALSWREHAVQQLKTALLGLPLRQPVYAGAPYSGSRFVTALPARGAHR